MNEWVVGILIIGSISIAGFYLKHQTEKLRHKH